MHLRNRSTERATVDQGSVETYARCGEILDNHFFQEPTIRWRQNSAITWFTSLWTRAGKNPKFLCPPRRRGTLSDTAIRPSVSLSQPRLYTARWLRGAAAARWLPAVNSWPTFSPYLYNRVWSELTCRNWLSHSRLACSRLSAHIQPSVNNPRRQTRPIHGHELS